MASYGGVDLGSAVHCEHVPEPWAVQRESFGGITGVMSLDMGGRGRCWKITGVWEGVDLASMFAAEASFLSLQGGIAREFVDSQGNAWPYVIFEGGYEANPEGPYATDPGWCLSYRVELRGLV